MHLDPKALEAATAAYNETIFTSDADHTSRIIRAYLKATTPADVEGLVSRLTYHATINDDMGRVVQGQPDAMREAASALRSQAQRIGELEDDVVEFMHRLDGRWFLEQNWFPKTVTEGSDLSSRARAALAKEGNGNG